ncbi:30S ribosomal protein S9 [bacterium]|nr:30S ribosomal protein S9 [bacterium]MBL7052957.1 30S ribosomal protein S9 [Candidatus Neomarinimicrobiota bacterium]
MIKSDYTLATGRRKAAVAQVRVKPGKGKFLINQRKAREYLMRDSLMNVVTQPLALLDVVKKYDINVKVKGGGQSGQAGAIRLGVSRALDKINSDFHLELKQAGFLTRDARVVERKKYGRPGARKRFQFSKR